MANFKQTTNESIAIFEQNVTQTVQELQNFVNNYFANLDVQEEINNKLDQMVIDGVFDNILINYAKIQKIYLTHTDLIADATLINGMKVKTYGYYSLNDGGNAQYLIRTKTVDDVESAKVEFIGSTLVAELISQDNTISPTLSGYPCTTALVTASLTTVFISPISSTVISFKNTVNIA